VNRSIQRFLVAIVGFCAANWPGSATSGPKLDSLIVYGEGFAFSVREPNGWVGDTGSAGKLGANILFYPKGVPFESATLIRVTVAHKSDEHTEEDVAEDMKQYRAEYPGVRFEEFAASHTSYRVLCKLFTVPASFFEYVCYVNPGPSRSLLLSVSMNKSHTEATDAELSAYRSVLASLTFL
jgi:hypothetical protein